ncbi:type II secretion system protein GspD [Veillonella sp. 3310]|uniref:type II secretion system protein GspD n=1 Tax=Veillonella sp. 3310 TaxID=2490956 RepID=UPI000FD6AFED|nr:type II and III secretion system protein [Veillonella sp. 3310]
MLIRTLKYLRRKVEISIYQPMYRWGIAYTLIMVLLGIIPVEAVHIMAKDMPLRTLVQTIARTEKLSVVGLDTLEGKVTLEVRENSGKEAINKLGSQLGFLVYEEGGTFIVEGRHEEKERRHVRRIVAETATPEELNNLIQTVVPKEHIQVIRSTNEVIYYGTVHEILEVEKVLGSWHTTPKQVQLDVAVLAMEKGYAKELGIQWSFPGLQSSGLSMHGKSESGIEGNVHIGHVPKGTSYSFLAHPELSAKEGSSHMALIARPSIVAVNGEEAAILIGERVPVTVESIQNGVTRTSIRYEEAGIRLRCKPYVLQGNHIDTIVEAEVSNPTLVPEMKAYRITTRQAKTRVRIPNGETLVIGGLMDRRTMRQWQKVPILGDIPLIGKLFQHSRKTKDEVELYILVTARVIPEIP